MMSSMNYERDPGGGFIVKLKMPRSQYIYDFIASFGEHCRVLSPEDIRTGTISHLKKTLENYL